MGGNDCRLGEWTIRPQRDCIERGEEVMRLKPKAMAVLECLIQADGEVVTRNDLFDRVWPGAVVSDATLTQCVVELRHAFKDSAKSPKYIETVPKVGFRLIPPVVALGKDAARESDSSSEPPSSVRTPVIKRYLMLTAAVLVVLVLAVYLVGNRGASPSSDIKEYKTIAVLPFRDMSEDQSQGWFADGLSEELINRLGELEGLQVTGRTSSSYFKYKNVHVGEIAENLGVDHVLEGSVRKEPGRLRITASLIEASRGIQLWSKVFDRPLEDIFDVQQEIAESVATALSIRLEVGRLGDFPGGTNNVRAFELYLRAMGLFQAFTTESMLEAIDLLKAAVELDPDFAYAWLWLTQLYKMAPMAIDGRLPLDWNQLAEEALAEARRIDSSLPAVLGMEVNQFTHGAQWKQVEETMAEARSMELSMDPGLPFFYGIFLLHVGRVDEAVSMLERARLLEPMAAHTARMLGFAYLMNGRTEEALEEYESAWRLDNVIRSVGSSEGLVAALTYGDREIIRKWLDRAIEFAGGTELGFYVAMDEWFDDRLAALAWLRDSHEKGDIDTISHFLPTWAAYYGDTQLALEVMERLPNSWGAWNPLMAEVRQQPEFKVIMQKLGLVDYWRSYTWADLCRPVSPDDFECE